MLSLFSDIFFIIKELDIDKNFLIKLFINLDLFFSYKDIFYSTHKLSECELNSEEIKIKDANEYFFNSISSILEFIIIE